MSGKLPQFIQFLQNQYISNTSAEIKNTMYLRREGGGIIKVMILRDLNGFRTIKEILVQMVNIRKN